MKRRTRFRIFFGAVTLLAVATCAVRDSVSRDTARGTAAMARVTIVGDSQDDARPSAIREALAHWNVEAARLALSVRLDSGTLISKSVPDAALRAASGGMP